MYSILSFGVAWARKSSTPASAAMAAAVSGLPPEAVLLLGQNGDRAALARLVGEAGQLGRIGKLLLGRAVDRQERHGLTVPQRDRAGLVEQQRVDVSCSLDRLAAHGKDVVLHD